MEQLNEDIRIEGNSSSIYFSSSQVANTMLENNTFGIKLYARKTDRYVMGKEKKVWLKPVSSVQEMPHCTVNHSLPAIIFSSGGYAGNIFHDISDVLIPLYLTSLPFNGEVQLLSQDRHSWWIKRHELMFKALSNYEVIDFNRDKEVRCFKNAIVGVKSHRDFGIDPKKFPYGLTLRNFTRFPRLLIISRKKTRAILNEDELVTLATSLGYDVEIIDARMSLNNFSKIVNSIDVIIGVHGAGLTNMVYLPENAVLIQVIPIGLESIAKLFYEYPARNMSLQYLPYKISVTESSLIQQYPIQHQVFTNPNIAKKEGWLIFKKVYMDNQDVRLDFSRFKCFVESSTTSTSLKH
ncbi:EGF domain-specific O-linked N-acetylglucosamine transferase [Bienertia sinuspersici]